MCPVCLHLGSMLAINCPCLPLLPGVFSNIDNHGMLSLKDTRDHLVPSAHYPYDEPEVHSGDVSYPSSHGESPCFDVSVLSKDPSPC